MLNLVGERLLERVKLRNSEYDQEIPQSQTTDKPVLVPDSAVVKAQKILSSHGGFLTISMYH